MNANTKRLFIHAPNIHTGGGLKLLQGLITSAGKCLAGLHLDERAQQHLQIPTGVTVQFIKPTFRSRLSAEWRLRRLHTDSLVICPGGLPPLFRIRADTAVLALNCLFVDGSRLDHFPLWPRCRITIERLWFRFCQSHATSYVAQTASMAALLKDQIRPDADIIVMPFDEPSPKMHSELSSSVKYDFVYPANGDAHKNHLKLLQAWCLLAERGLMPSLALTINSASYPVLLAKIVNDIQAHGLKITNLGYLSQPEISDVYAASGALIFPSLTESFGLPLIEARDHGIPILAPELDYVRDVSVPVQTFDPESAVSITRAVRRFMGEPESVLKVFTTKELVDRLLK